MKSENLYHQLRTLFPTFAQHELLKEITERGQWINLPPAHQVFAIGNMITLVPLVLSGSVKVIREDEEGNEIFLYYIKAGESCAMTLTSCLKKEKSVIKAVVESAVSAIALPVDVVYDFVHRFPTWNVFMTETYARRFEEILAVLDDVAFHKLDVRLFKYLIERSHVLHSKSLTISRTQIAKDLNSSREVISRLLKQMERKQLIKIAGSQIELLEQ